MVTQGGCVGWFKQRSNLEKTLLTLSCLLLLTLILVILIGSVFKEKPSVLNLEGIPGCWSPKCIKSAGQILSSMNKSADPCLDFYDYACGGYDSVTGKSSAEASADEVYLSIKEFLESSSMLGEYIDSLKSFYKSCMNFGGLHTLRQSPSEHLLNLMDRYNIGRWPVLDDFYEAPLTIDERLSHLAMLGVPVAFNLGVVPSSAEDGTHSLKISPGGPLESGRTALQIRGDQDLKNYMLFTFLLLGTSTNTKPNRTADEIRIIDSYYANIEQDTETNCDTIDILSPEEALKMLNTLIPEMNWSDLFNILRRDAGLRKNFGVELHCKAKIKDYLNHLKDQVDVISQDYLGWRFYESFAKHIEPAPQRTMSGNVPRWKECARLLEQYAGPTLLEMLSEDENQENIQKEVEEIVSRISTSTEKSLSNVHWLDRQKKFKLVRQVGKTMVRTPFVKINSSDDNQNIKIPQVQGDYTAAVIEGRRQLLIRQFKRLDFVVEEVEDYDLGMFQLTSESHNEKQLPVSVYFNELREPFFRFHGSESWNYGGLGVALATKFSRELLSESVGISSDDRTSVWDKWSSDSKVSSCLLNELSKKFDMNFQNRTEKLLSELFVDASSLEFAAEASKNARKPSIDSILPGLQDIKDEQMFFLAYAQTMCEAKNPRRSSPYIPIKKRINALLSNLKSFDSAFGCSSTNKKCPIWN